MLLMLATLEPLQNCTGATPKQNMRIIYAEKLNGEKTLLAAKE
jgi:hypothetical protein